MGGAVKDRTRNARPDVIGDILSLAGLAVAPPVPSGVPSSLSKMQGVFEHASSVVLKHIRSGAFASMMFRAISGSASAKDRAILRDLAIANAIIGELARADERLLREFGWTLRDCAQDERDELGESGA